MSDLANLKDEFEIPTPEELESMDTLLASLKETLSSISAEQKTLAAELQVLSSKPTLKALRANIATLSANVDTNFRINFPHFLLFHDVFIVVECHCRAANACAFQHIWNGGFARKKGS